MRLWQSQSDYTAILYKGSVPRTVIVTSEGVEIPPKLREASEREIEPEFPTVKLAGGLIEASKLIAELQETVQVHQRNDLPANTVTGIIRRSTQFTLQNRIDTVRADVNEWSDPPHVALANCPFDGSKDVKWFVENYGFGPGMVYDPNLRFPRSKAMTISVERLRQDQEFLRESWGKTDQAQAFKKSFLWSPDDVDFVDGKPKIILSDIWDYILVLFLIDLSAGRLKVCANPSCRRLKYFIQERRNQKFCSVSCKNTLHVNLFLANPENREAWNAARRDKAARPKVKTARGGKR